ncbi:transporter substrate-binding domain-containing protein [Kaistia geumhonensis]|uniref:Polar amino acid transport system substrate-binding protein n=1 Tax=Kaistia geumhonensis TaxID=410839 RepID=A0ABU0M5Y5_9HYPH|nr:transporter substrate-binding domain-containing protein [Kaistia geumhonensis]MCX5478417.1 transporter substrate-binding domain-containing protein [Kaistia geumhonensis]MDQ0516365.1 polar amino acid transport system substrate-binding protein [Kaistia geumhonensis]
MTRRLAIPLRGLMVAIAIVLAAVASADEVVIPNFFDPGRRIDLPPAAALTPLRFATVGDFPPFSFTGSDGTLTGFNVELARAICRELAVACTMQTRPFDSLGPSIVEGRIDAAIAGIAITATARESLGFSDVYLRPAARFIGPVDERSTDIGAAALRGRTVAVAAGSAHEAYLASFFPEARRLAVSTPVAAAEAVREGEADFAFGDGTALAFWQQSPAARDCCAFVGGPYLESRFFGEGYAVALPKDRPELRQAVNWALDSLYDKGVFAELYLRYFPVSYF